MTTVRDEFLSEEDLDLRNLTDEELVAYWNQWLEQAQATNAADAHEYSHGVFAHAPPARRLPRVPEERPTCG
ncbi:MAG: hypothetical protein HQ559_05820 [Lentisphaerae bacterium]|nr:hypothetical protein [Lentisphaerota bacterium]